MNSHKNARLTAKGRAHPIEQIVLLGLDEAARHAGISTRRARIWLKRAAAEGWDTLTNRSSRPHASPRAAPFYKKERIVNLRRNHRLTYAVIASRVGVSVATVGRVCAQAGVARLPSWIQHYNFCRPHSATSSKPPATRLGLAGNNVLRNQT